MVKQKRDSMTDTVKTVKYIVCQAGLEKANHSK